MTATEATLLMLMPFLLAASAFFSGCETALFGLSEHERTLLARRSPLSARAADALLLHPRMLLITILLGNMAVNVLFLVMASVLALHAATPTLRATFTLAPLLAVILLGEVTPKLIATSQRVRWCAVFLPALQAIHRVIAPIRVALSVFVVEPAARLAGSPPVPELSADELGELLEISAAEGEIDPAEAELLDDVVELSALRAREIMTPRTHLQTIALDATRDEIMAIARDTPFTQIPIHDGAPDRTVVGVLDLRDYFAHPEDSSDPASVKEIMAPPLFIPEQARLDRLLTEFQRRGRLAAVVVDEYGGIAGFVTFGDIAHRLAIGLEHETSSFQEAGRPRIERIGPARWRVPGRLSVHDLVGVFGPTGRGIAGSVAGLLNAELGRIARPGDCVRVGFVDLVVESVRGRAVDQVIVSLVAPTGDGGSS